MSKEIVLIVSFISLFLWGCRDNKKAEKYRDESFEKSKNKDYAGAIQLLEKALSYEERDIVSMASWDSTLINLAYLEWANEKYKNNDVQGAIELCNTVLKRDKYYCAAYGNRSFYREQLHDLEGALTDAENYLAALTHNPFTNVGYYPSTGWKRRGDLNFALGRYNTFLEDYEKAATYATSDSLRADIYTTMANVAFDKLKDGKLILEYADKAIQFNPNLSTPYLYRAIIYRAGKMKKEACEAIHQYMRVSRDKDIKDLKSFCE